MSYKLFKSTSGPCRYVFKNGNVALFKGGRYATDIESEIKELEDEVKNRHPTIYVDSAEAETDALVDDPIANLRKEIINDYLRNMGNSEKVDPRVGMVNSKTIAETSAASTSGATPAAVTK